jgi:hypothetical protein
MRILLKNMKIYKKSIKAKKKCSLNFNNLYKGPKKLINKNNKFIKSNNHNY